MGLALWIRQMLRAFFEQSRLEENHRERDLGHQGQGDLSGILLIGVFVPLSITAIPVSSKIIFSVLSFTNFWTNFICVGTNVQTCMKTFFTVGVAIATLSGIGAGLLFLLFVSLQISRAKGWFFQRLLPSNKIQSLGGVKNGRWEYANGDVYEGEFKSDNQTCLIDNQTCPIRHGKGVLKLKDGSMYTGEWKDDKRNGKGTFTDKKDDKGEGSTYEGEWKDDKQHGTGVLKWNGSMYSGEFRDGEFHGTGAVMYPDGSSYHGKFKYGRRHSQGKLENATTGEVYDGEWKDGKKDGVGTYTDANGSVYRGGWKEDVKHGKGITRYADGKVIKCKYESGKIKDDKTIFRAVRSAEMNEESDGNAIANKKKTARRSATFSGVDQVPHIHNNAEPVTSNQTQAEMEKAASVLDLKHAGHQEGEDSSKYQGGWKDGKRHGTGVLKTKAGCIYSGKFHGGEFHGMGNLIYPDGSIYHGQWEDGFKHGHGKMENAMNGESYDGEWRWGEMDGQGTYIDADGNVYQGGWKKGKKYGDGIMRYVDGIVVQGRYEDDLLVVEGACDVDIKEFEIFNEHIQSNSKDRTYKKPRSMVVGQEHKERKLQCKGWVNRLYSSVLNAEKVRDRNQRTKWKRTIYSKVLTAETTPRIEAKVPIQEGRSVKFNADEVHRIQREEDRSESGSSTNKAHDLMHAVMEKSKSDRDFKRKSTHNMARELAHSLVDDNEKGESYERSSNSTKSSHNLMHSALEKAKSDRDFQRLSTQAVARNAAQALLFKADGDSAFRKMDFKEAIEKYTEAIEMDPTNADYFVSRSAAYLKKNTNSKALDDANKSIGLDPKLAKAHCLKGEALIGLGQYNNAMAAYQEGLNMCPDSLALQVGLDNVGNFSKVSLFDQ